MASLCQEIEGGMELEDSDVLGLGFKPYNHKFMRAFVRRTRVKKRKGGENGRKEMGVGKCIFNFTVFFKIRVLFVWFCCQM